MEAAWKRRLEWARRLSSRHRNGCADFLVGIGDARRASPQKSPCEERWPSWECMHLTRRIKVSAPLDREGAEPPYPYPDQRSTLLVPAQVDLRVAKTLRLS